MRRVALILLLLAAGAAAQARGQRLLVFFQQVAVGAETYTMTPGELTARFQYTERGTSVETVGTLRFQSDWTPAYYDVHGKVYRPFSVNATVTPQKQTRPFFTVASYPPLSVQMVMLRYWLRHGRPTAMKHLPSGDDIEIRETGTDTVAGVRLRRYAVGGVVWGQEALWLDPQQNLAAAVTYAGNLPLEAVRPEYQAGLHALIASAIRDRMAWLRDGAVAPLATGSYAIVHARLIDGTGAAEIPDSTVVVRGTQIVAAGAYGKVAIPAHARVIDAHGETLLPGLWEMHAHMAQVEYGPAYLAAGVTSARDCGGEFEFLVALHGLLQQEPGLGPNLLMAGLLDGSGPNTFTTNWADTPEQGRAMVQKYKAAGFVQIKIYDYIKPDVLSAITAEAHRLGMTVTGHIPKGMTAFEGVEHGMDQINHLGYVAQEVRAVGLQQTVDFLVQHHTVVDPTLAWGELLSHRPEVPIASFEPGFARAPYALQSMIGSASGRGENLARSFRIVKALYDAGVPLVAGTDKSVPAVSLHRELELYVQAGLTPMQVIDLATSGSARVMGEGKIVGTIAPGMRADMILVQGDPLQDFSALRQVRRVVTFGRMYDTAPLWQRAGFRPLAQKAPDLPDGLYAEVTTAKGVIVMRLRPDAAPMAVASFVGLAEGTIANQALDPGQPYFDRSTFNRVVPGHVIQTGVPNSTRAKAPGYMFPNEIDARLSHNHAGAVGMANGGSGTNASQWYITLGDRSYLDGDYTVFGEVVRGLDVVMQIRQGDALDTVRILRVGKTAAAYHPTTASFEALVAAAKERVAREASQRERALAAWVKKNYPRATGPEGGVLSVPSPLTPPSSPLTLHVSYRGKVVRYVGNWTHYSGPAVRVTDFASGPNGVPGFHATPMEFDYTPGQTKLNPGLDAALAMMRPGDRRTIVVPAAQGYGKNGLYPPEVHGQPRFVINPHVVLIYQVAVSGGD